MKPMLHVRWIVVTLLAMPIASAAQIETIAPRSQPGLDLVRSTGLTARDVELSDSTGPTGNAGDADSDLPTLEGINISAAFLVRSEDIQAGNYIAPSANGHFEQRLFGANKPLRGQWYVNLAIQAPSTADDSAAYLNRLMASGGTGNLSLGTKVGLYGRENRSGAMLSLQGRVSWTNQQQLSQGAIPSLGFGSVRLSGSFWGGPLIGAVEVSGNRLFSEPSDNGGPVTGEQAELLDEVESTLEGPLSVVVSAAVKFTLMGTGSNAPQYLTIRYLVPTGDVPSTNNLEIRFVQTLDLFR
jgi:hypothetical protein